MSEQAGTKEAGKNETVADAAAPEGMTKEEKSFLMRTIWESLIESKWTDTESPALKKLAEKDNLINFGKAIFTRKPLKEMSDAEFALIYPFLRNIAMTLGEKLLARKAKNDAEEAASAAAADAKADAASDAAQDAAAKAASGETEK